MSTTTTLKPVALGLAPTFGFGDRLGTATPGHLEALRRAGGPIKGIFAQQSIREMTRTKRTAGEVMKAAVDALAEAEYFRGWGADADHLKTHADVDYTADAGFVFFTIDPSEHVGKGDADADWLDGYRGKTVEVDGIAAPIRFDEGVLRAAAVKYGKAIDAAIDMAGYIKTAATQRGQPCEIELSVDETQQPTTLAEHYLIADRMRAAGVKLVSLAPRFIGELEKGVDYKGDPRKLEASLKEHAAVARQLGPYKLSLHSGSDKLSMYTLFARATGGLFHVKTAGTSYLEALRAVSRHDQKLFRRIIDFARSRYDTDKATYHVSARVADAPPPEAVKDAQELERIYLECWEDVPRGEGFRGFTAPGRQILHCTFGSVLTHAQFGPAVHQIIREHPATYRDVLADHFVRHLEALTAGM